MFANEVLDTQYRAIGVAMWTILTLVFCAAYPAQTAILHQEIGVIHIHKKYNVPHPAAPPLRPDDVEATENAATYFKNYLELSNEHFGTIEKSVRSIFLPELNAVFTLALNNFLLKGIRYATLDNLAVRMSNSRVDFNASLPFLSAGGTVFVNGVIDNNIFTVVGNLSSFSDDVKISGILDIHELQVPSQVHDVLQITDADITIDIKSMMIDFKIIEKVVLFKNTLAKFMNKPVDDIVKSVSRAAIMLVNEQLAKIPAGIITDFLVPMEYPVPPFERRSPHLGMTYPNYRRYGYN